MRAFDSRQGVLRDAKFVRSRFLALYLTEDNLETLMRSMNNAEKAQKAAKTILKRLKDAWTVRRDAIDESEVLWTGEDRENTTLYPPDKIFLVTTSVAAFISPDWDLTRELSCLAVSEDALQALWKYSGLPPSHEADFGLNDLPHIKPEAFLKNLRMFINAGIQITLLAALSRSRVSSKVLLPKDHEVEVMAGELWVASEGKLLEWRIKYRFDAARVSD